jgi:hypothetical protein
VIPAGLDALFQEIGTPTTPGVFLPPPELTPEDLKRLMAAAEKHGQKVYPPDYLG